MTTTQETPISTGTIQNTCTCVMFDDNGEPTDEPTSYCYGDCWTDSVDDFTNVTEQLRDSNDTDWWQVKGLRLWDGEVGGLFHANEVEQLLHGMAVRGEWTMRYKVFADRIEYSLSHHDSPTGSTTVLTAVTEEQREEWGLY